MWNEVRQAAVAPPRHSSRPPMTPTKETNLDMPADDDPSGSPFGSSSSSPGSFDNVLDVPVDKSGGGDVGGAFDKPFFSPDDDDDDDNPGDDSSLGLTLARHLGIGGHGPQVADRLSFLALADQSPAAPAAEEAATGTVPDAGTVPGILPSLYFGDLRAGDGAATAEAMELCHGRGVQAFSVRYVGGEGGEEAGKGAEAAADYEYEDVSAAVELALSGRNENK